VRKEQIELRAARRGSAAPAVGRRPLAGAIGWSSPPLPGRRADDRSSRPARAVVAYIPRNPRIAVAADTEPADDSEVAHPRDESAATHGGPAGERPARAATRVARRALYTEAVALIRRDYASDLRLTDVGRRIGASPRALQRAFAQEGKRSFSQELQATRLDAAEQLLRTTDLSVGAIARRVGYHDHAPFTKAFRRHHGTAPSAHRAKSAPAGYVSHSPADTA
jgi:AraC family transcriptional regulator of adaptative response / methylphosphotriester-DNA alkyltransferase methyltransferase